MSETLLSELPQTVCDEIGFFLPDLKECKPHAGDGTPSNTLLNTVSDAPDAEDVRPLCDTVTVQAAKIVPCEVGASLILCEGPGVTRGDDFPLRRPGPAGRLA